MLFLRILENLNQKKKKNDLKVRLSALLYCKNCTVLFFGLYVKMNFVLLCSNQWDTFLGKPQFLLLFYEKFRLYSMPQ